MEKIDISNLKGKVLVGDLYSVKSEQIVIMSHGFFADRSHGGTVKKIVEPINEIGVDVLSFDFSGCGESTYDKLSLKTMIDDLEFVISFVKEMGYKKIGLFGFSLGGLISLECFNSDIVTMVVCAPLTENPNYDWGKKFSDQMKDLENVGYLIKKDEFGLRKEIHLDRQLIKDFEKIQMKKVLKGITCPVLIIHGTKDTHIPVENSKKAMKFLSKESKLELIEGCDHFFSEENIDKMAALTKDWFLEKLSD